MQSQKRQKDLCSFPRKPFIITVIQGYAPTSNAEEAEVEQFFFFFFEVEQFFEDLQELLELAPKKDVIFIIGDWNAKAGCQSDYTRKLQPSGQYCTGPKTET